MTMWIDLKCHCAVKTAILSAARRDMYIETTERERETARQTDYILPGGREHQLLLVSPPPLKLLDMPASYRVLASSQTAHVVHHCRYNMLYRVFRRCSTSVESSSNWPQNVAFYSCILARFENFFVPDDIQCLISLPLHTAYTHKLFLFCRFLVCLTFYCVAVLFVGGALNQSLYLYLYLIAWPAASHPLCHSFMVWPKQTSYRQTNKQTDELLTLYTNSNWWTYTIYCQGQEAPITISVPLPVWNCSACGLVPSVSTQFMGVS